MEELKVEIDAFPPPDVSKTVLATGLQLAAWLEYWQTGLRAITGRLNTWLYSLVKNTNWKWRKVNTLKYLMDEEGIITLDTIPTYWEKLLFQFVQFAWRWGGIWLAKWRCLRILRLAVILWVAREMAYSRVGSSIEWITSCFCPDDYLLDSLFFCYFNSNGEQWMDAPLRQALH